MSGASRYYLKGASDVRPILAPEDRIYGAWCHAVVCRNRSTRARVRADGNNLFLGQLRCVPLASKRSVASPFPRAVFVVVVSGAKKQVARLYAPWRVAAVANKHSVRNWAISNQPRHAVCVALLALVAKVRVIVGVCRDSANAASCGRQEITSPQQGCVRSLVRLPAVRAFHGISTKMIDPVFALWRDRAAKPFPGMNIMPQVSS